MTDQLCNWEIVWTTYYEGSPLRVFNTDEIELKLKIFCKLKQDNTECFINFYSKKNHTKYGGFTKPRFSIILRELQWKPCVKIMMMMMMMTMMMVMMITFAKRSMQKPEQHWKSSDVSLARPVSFAALQVQYICRNLRHLSLCVKKNFRSGESLSKRNSRKSSLDTLVSLGRGFPAPRCICRSRGPA